jgi:GNAT superfamily N-acetyltransferase
MADPIQLPDAEKQQYDAAFASSAPPPINPIKDFDAPELAHLATQDLSFKLVDEFRRNQDLWKDPATVQKVADAHNLIKQRGFQVGDIAAVRAAKEGHPIEAAGAVVKPAYEIAKGFGKQLWNYATAAAVPFISAAGEVTGQGPGFTEELGNIGQRAVAENIAGTEQAVTGLGEMAQKAAGKIGRAVGLAKPLSDYTPEEKAHDLWNAVGTGETQADIARGHGGFLTLVGGEVVKGLEEAGKPVRPEETAVTAAGDPFSLWAFGKAFQGAGKVIPPGLSRAGAAVTEATGEKLAQVAGKGAQVVGKVAQKVAGGAENLGKVVEVAAPLLAGGKALMTGDWGNVFEEGLGGKFGGQALEKVGEYSKSLGQKLISGGEQIAGTKPVVSPYAQLARDVITTAPGAVSDLAKGAAFDLGLGEVTSETPQDTEGLGIGTVFGALGAGRRVGGRALSGQLIAPRDYGIKTPQASSGQFPALDSMHNAAFRNADPGVKARLNAIRLFVKGAAPDADIFMGDDAGIESALAKQGVNPDQAKQIADQSGFFTTALQGKDGKRRQVIIVKDVAAAPHEAFHALQDVIGEPGNQQIDAVVKKAYANQWDAEGTDYAQRLAGGQLPGTWQETILDRSGWGQDAAKTKIYTDIGNRMRAESGAEPRASDVQAQAQHELGRLTDEALSRNSHLDPTEAQSQAWRDVLSPDEAKSVADKYLARELAAENFDAVLKHTGGQLNDPKGILPYFADKIGKVISAFGGEPLAGRVSEIGQIAPKTPVVEAVRGLAKSRLPEVAPQVAPQATPKGPKPIVGIPNREDNAADAGRIADAAPNVPTAKGGKSPRELLGQVAEAIAQGTGIKINYLSAPDEPAAATTSNRVTRREIIEAYRTMPPEARALWEKSFFPDRVIQTKQGYQVQGWAPEVFASNAHKMAATLAKIGPEAIALSPYEIDPDTHTFTPDGWKRLYEDTQKFVANQQAGRTGAGESLVVPKEMAERGVYAPQVKGPGVALDQHSADFINTLFNFKLPETPRMQKGKLPLNIAGQEVSAATQAGRVEVPVRPRGEYTGAEAEKQGIAGREIAEVNPVRNQIEAVAQKAGVAMPSMIEAMQKLNLDNIKEIEHAPELPEFRGNTLTLTAGFQPKDWRVLGQLRGVRKETTIKAESETEARTKAAAQGYRVEKVTSLAAPTAMTVGMFQPKTDFARNLAKQGFDFEVEGELGNRSFNVLKDGKQIGSLRTTSILNEQNAMVNMVHIDPAYQKKDLGEALYREAANQLQADGVKTLTGLAVHPAPVKIREKVFGPGNTTVEETGVPNALGVYPKEAVSRIEPGAQFQPKSPAKAMDWMQTQSNEDFSVATKNFKGRFGGGPTGWAYEIGANAKTPEDLQSLLTAGKVWTALGEKQRASGDFGASFASLTKAQLAHEAYSVATGTDIEGKPTQAGVGFIKKYFDPNYEPPMAPKGEEVTGQAQPPARNEDVNAVAEDYATSAGIKLGPSTYAPLDEAAAKRVADHFEQASHDPTDQKVIKAYNALAKETEDQYHAIEAAGYTLEPFTGKGEPYKNSADMVADVTNNKHLYYLPTNTAFGGEGQGTDNLMLRPSGIEGRPVNDIFRAVHDFFGHAKENYQFGPRGEYNAWREHSQMYSADAQPALAAETLAQNAWVNFGPHLRTEEGNIPKVGESGYVAPAARRFAEQKNFAVEPAVIESMQAQPAKRKDEFKFLSGGPSGISKSWILPSGAPAQLGGMWHHHFLAEDPQGIAAAKKAGITVPPFEGTDTEGVRESALRKGFVRVNYTQNSGTMTVEGRAKDWRKQKDSVMKMVESNIGDLDNIKVNVLDDAAKKVVDSGHSQLFNYDTDEEKLQHIPFITEGEIRGGQYQPSAFSDKGFEDKLQSVRGGQVGGVTFNPDGTEWTPPAKPVDVVTLASVNVPAKDLTREKVLSALGPYSDLLDEPGVVAGVFSFSKEGAPTVSIDVNAVVDQKHRKNSLDFAKQNDQVAIWDADKQQEIQSGGKGNTRLSSIGEITDALTNLTRGKPVDVDEILKQNRPSEAGQLEAELPGVGKRVLGTQEQSNMTKADLASHFPESVIPRRRDEPIPSDIKKSPLAKEAGDEPAAIKAFARKLVEFAHEYSSDPRYQSGLKWYSEFVPQLKEKFGKDSPIMAELLAATSPQTAPDQNYAFAVDALAGLKSGRFDKLRAKYEEGLAKLNDGTWTRWYNRENNAGRIINPPAEPTPAAFLEHWVDKFDLKPRQSNGKLYGVSSVPVLQVISRQWLQNTSGPKTQNFVQNLLGTGHGATIDLWADRTMRRVGYSGFVNRWRIMPKNATAVTDADFAFSQKAFAEAAKQLGIEPDALQGGLWFAEKAHWNNNGWGRLDLGDYRKEIPKTEALQAGVKARERRVAAEAKTKPMETAELPITVEPRKLR